MPDAKMNVIEMSEPGGPEVLIMGTRELPKPTDSQVLIKVTAAGVNGPDLVQRKGFYPPPKGASDLLGLEVSGEIVSMGREVQKWEIGDRVCALTNGGGYAEYVAVETAHCLPIPDDMSEIDAAGLPETYFTVWSNVFYAQKLPEGGLFLAHGGAGGIGSTAIQLGSALGLRMYTTEGSPEACDFCRTIGAERAINYKDEDFVGITREAGAANIILDTIGGDYIAKNIKASAPDARIIQLAFNKGSKVEIDLMPVMLKRLHFTGSTLRSRPDLFKSKIAADLKEKVWPMFPKGTIKPVTHAVLPFDQAAKAHEMMQKGGHMGKIILTPPGTEI